MPHVDCHNCGGRVDIPDDHTRPRIRCEHCGYYVDVPATLRGHVDEVIAIAEPAIKLEAPHLLAGTDDEEDSQPYTVPGDASKKCKTCFKAIALDATFCVHCGSDVVSGKKAKKTYEVIDRFWEPRWPKDLRFKVWLGLHLFNLIVGFTGGSLVGGFIFVVLQSGLQAFLLGSYECIRVQRTSKGTATLTRSVRLAFFALKPKKLDWKPSHGIGIIATHQHGFFEWFIFIDLLLCGILPGLAFWWFVMRPDRFQISLCDEYGSTNEIIFRTTEREQTEDVCRTINDATGLWYKPVL